jgi:hypothetical protein
MVKFQRDDLDNIKSLSKLATSNQNTFLSFGRNAIDDMNKNQVVAIGSDSARQVSWFYHDTVSPELTSFDLDMDIGLLTLYFSETVNGSSLDVNQIRLQTEQIGGSLVEFHTLGNSTVDHTKLFGIDSEFVEYYGDVSASESSPEAESEPAAEPSAEGNMVGDARYGVYSHTIRIDLSDADLNEIKRLTTLAIDETSTYISFTSDMINDMNQSPPNKVDLVAMSEAKLVDKFTSDTTPPTLDNYTLNLTSEILVLYFSETIKRDSLNITKFSFRNGAPGSEHRRLTKAETLTVPDSTTIEIKLSWEDLNYLKLVRNMSSDEHNTFVTIESTFAEDMQGNPIVTISSSEALPVQSFTEDTVAPVLRNFDFNLDTFEITLSFSETVKSETLNISICQFVVAKTRPQNSSTRL